MKDLIEACLFVSAEPVTIQDVAQSLSLDLDTVYRAFEDLVAEYQERRGGLIVIEISGGYQMATRPDLADSIAKILDRTGGRNRLSKPALETLAIIAYRQPVTQAEVESVRGVNADGVLKTLLEKKLIAEHSRKAVPGRPILYATTRDFLHYFGLSSLDALPEIERSQSSADLAARHAVEEAVGLGDQ